MESVPAQGRQHVAHGEVGFQHGALPLPLVIDLLDSNGHRVALAMRVISGHKGAANVGRAFRSVGGKGNVDLVDQRVRRLGADIGSTHRSGSDLALPGGRIAEAGAVERQVNLRSVGERDGERCATGRCARGGSDLRLRAIRGDADGAGDRRSMAGSIEREERSRNRLNECGVRSPRPPRAKDIDDRQVVRNAVGHLKIDLCGAHVEERREERLARGVNDLD